MFIALHRFVYKHCIENDYTLESAGVSLSVIGSEIQEIGFPRHTGKLRRLLERRSDLFQVFDKPHQGVSVYAHAHPRRPVTSRSQPPQPMRPQAPVQGPVASTLPSDSMFRSRLFAAYSSSAIALLTYEFFRPLSSGSAATASNPPSSGGLQSSSRVASANGIGYELRLLFPTTDVVRASFCDARAPRCVNFNIGISRRKYWTLQLKRPVITLQQLGNFCCPGVALLLPNQM